MQFKSCSMVVTWNLHVKPYLRPFLSPLCNQSCLYPVHLSWLFGHRIKLKLKLNIEFYLLFLAYISCALLAEGWTISTLCVFSVSFTKVEEKENRVSRMQRYRLIREYTYRSMLPAPLCVFSYWEYIYKLCKPDCISQLESAKNMFGKIQKLSARENIGCRLLGLVNILRLYTVYCKPTALQLIIHSNQPISWCVHLK